MADAGNEVWAVDTWKDHVDAINRDGLRVEGASGDRTVRSVRATTDGSDIGVCDLVIVATKASGVAAAARTALSLTGPETVILTIQNGLGAADRIAEAIPTSQVMLGVVGGFGASMKGPGHAHHNGMELVRLGEMDGGETKRLATVVKVWEDSGFAARGYPDIHQMIWEKLICNCTFSGPCCITGLTVGEVIANPDAWKIASACAAEADTVARTKGITLGFDDVESYVRTFGSRIANAKPSMLQDHEARRKSEIDAINGAIPVEAAKLGVAAPTNATVAALIRARESGF
jgi:2-dehydropantoate 2-reductase